MQKDLETVSELVKALGMTLNLEKCKVLHFGRNNPKSSYFLVDKLKRLNTVILKGDLRVLVAEVMRSQKHIDNVVTRSTEC